MSFNSPVFVLSCVLLITSPPALTLVQMTQAAAGPLTLIYVVIGLHFLG